MGAVAFPQQFRVTLHGWSAAHPVARFLVTRVLAAIATLFVVSILVFVATNILPGNAASVILGRQGSGPALAHLEREMGLNLPLVERYAIWIGNFVHGNLGNSAAGYAAGGRISVWSIIHYKVGDTLLLAGIAFVLAIPISIVLGVVAAVRANRVTDHAITIVSLTLTSFPEFVLGSLLILLFFTWLNVLPPVALFPPGVSPLTRPSALVLPVMTLLGVSVGAAIRMLRAGMLDTLRTEYVAMARLHGLAERRVLYRYALRNALGPSVQVFAQILQYLLGGIVIVEYLFAYPGLGAELINAVSIRDVFEVEAITMMFATAFVAINIVADLLVVLLVPKLRTDAR